MGGLVGRSAFFLRNRSRFFARASIPEQLVCGGERELMKTVQATETESITRLIEGNLELVNHIVFQVAIHFPRHVDRDDLARAGALGLVEAAKRFDEAKGVP